jgi:hypothetical protein
MLALQIAIGFGIAVIFPLLIYYGVSTFHPAPKPREKKENEAAYNAAAEAFSRVLVLAATLLGVGAVFVGTFLDIHFIGTGLVLGGIMSIAFGYWSYWRYLKDWMRFVSLLAGFAALLLVGVRWLSGP